jgi:hypothetical protein
MNPRVIVGIAAVVGTAACGLFGAILNLEMVEEVNSHLPQDSQFSPMGWYLSKTLRLHREYKRLFPTGTLLMKVRFAIAIGFGCLLGGVWALGFFQ